MEQPWGDLPEKNYDAGRPAASYAPSPFKHVNIVHMPKINGLTAMSVVRYALRAERHFLNAQRQHREAFSSHFGAGDQISLMRDELELMIYCMRKSLDHLIQGVFSKLYQSELELTGSIAVDSLGRALMPNLRRKYPELSAVVLGADAEKSSNFFEVVNELSNAFKHGFLVPESVAYCSPDRPNILVFDVPNKSVNEIPVVHNHTAVHLMMGYQDVFDRLLVDLGAQPLFAARSAPL
ncbi:hypothetical protein [Rhizobium sp.]|jgi:hypothetical protein|uniref:hypothetical protein n=1 Tax=Rhizobium sp. TaxID=391 RepID=UPI0011B93EB9